MSTVYDLKEARQLTQYEIHKICRMLGNVTHGQAADIADAIVSIQNGKETMLQAVDRIHLENE